MRGQQGGAHRAPRGPGAGNDLGAGACREGGGREATTAASQVAVSSFEDVLHLGSGVVAHRLRVQAQQYDVQGTQWARGGHEEVSSSRSPSPAASTMRRIRRASAAATFLPKGVMR